jgi:GT2 family glycosyltransferase
MKESMDMITALVPFSPQPGFERMLQTFLTSPWIEKVMIQGNEEIKTSWHKCIAIEPEALILGRKLNMLLDSIGTEYLLIVNHPSGILIEPDAIERFLEVAESTSAGMVYSDYYEEKSGGWKGHSINDYQLGSIRENFDFGPVMFFSMPAIRKALGQYGAIADTKYASLYDLRLKLSIDHILFHIQEFLYTKRLNVSGEALYEDHFDYVDPRNYIIQKEMEDIATEHLKNIGAFLKPGSKKAPPSTYHFPLEASVIIPVRNRERTVTDAIQSVLLQETDFPFNVIVVDNHSTDDTSDILSFLAKQNPKVKHIIPSRNDLSIGGCWNDAIASSECGRYAVQLDSDDLYSAPDTLQKIVDLFQNNDFAMVIGSYTLVNESLEEIPPGLIDHREWTDANGHNNALRVNGLGAPRAFNTALVREIGFLNVGYGEDYALALRLSREYRIGRIYESLYLCRRWAGNTDSSLSIEESNRNDTFKDKIRTIEIMARQKLNRERCI